MLNLDTTMTTNDKPASLKERQPALGEPNAKPITWAICNFFATTVTGARGGGGSHYGRVEGRKELLTIHKLGKWSVELWLKPPYFKD